jgi:hypothetical protein
MAQELPTKSDNKETQQRAGNEEKSGEDDGSKAGAASAQEEPYWTPPPQPPANEKKIARKISIIKNYPFGGCRDSSLDYHSPTPFVLVNNYARIRCHTIQTDVEYC